MNGTKYLKNFKNKYMKIKRASSRLARTASLAGMAHTYMKVANDLIASIKDDEIDLELIWFLKDSEGKIIKTGGCNKMPFRCTQIWRNWVSEKRFPGAMVYLIDINSGIKVERTIRFALSNSAKRLREDMICEMIGVSR